MAVYIDKLLVHEGGRVKEIDSTDTLEITGSLSTAGYLRVGQFSTGSLPSATGVAGALVYDSTAGKLKVSNGIGWTTPSVATLGESYLAGRDIPQQPYTTLHVYPEQGMYGGDTSINIETSGIDMSMADYWTKSVGDILISTQYSGNLQLAAAGLAELAGSEILVSTNVGTHLYFPGDGSVTLRSNTNALRLDAASTVPIYIGGTPNTNGTGSGDVYLGSGTNGVNTNARTVYIGEPSYTSPLRLRSGTGGITLSAGNQASSYKGVVRAEGASLALESWTNGISLVGNGAGVSISSDGGFGATASSTGAITLNSTGSGQILLSANSGAINLYSTSGSLDLRAGSGAHIYVGASGSAQDVYVGNLSGASKLYLQAGSGNIEVYAPLKLKGYATGSLPTASAMTGAVVYDSTTSSVKYSNGSVWTAFSTGSASSGTLQQAYDSGNGVTLSSGRPLSVTAPGSGTAAITLAANENSSFGVTSANLTIGTTTSGTLALTGATGITADNYIRLGNIATASLPTPTSIPGAVVYDSTAGALKWSNGTSTWQTFSSGAGNTLQQSYDAGASGNITISSGKPFTVDSTTLYVDHTGKVGVGTNILFPTFTSVGASGDSGASAIGARAPGLAQGELAGVSFWPTFQGTSDNGPRRAADIAAGFDGGAWGSQYLAFYVGSTTVNDAADLWRNAERMRIDASGNVGIGTFSPGSRLDIVGSASNASIHIRNDTASAWVSFFDSDDSMVVGLQTAGALRLFTDSHERLRITATGNVGVGTTSPGELLSLNSSGTGVTSRVEFKQGDTAYGHAGLGTDSKLRLQSTGSVNLGLETAGSAYVNLSTNSTERVRVTAAGNVGVATTSPQTALHVVSDAANTDIRSIVEGQLFLADSDVATSGLVLGYRNQPGTIEYGKLQARTASGASNLSLQPGGGNVGVGTNAPLSLLHVKGTTRIGTYGVGDLLLYSDGLTGFIGVTDDKPLTLASGFPGFVGFQLDSQGHVSIGSTTDTSAQLRVTAHTNSPYTLNTSGIIATGVNTGSGVRGTGGAGGGLGGEFYGLSGSNGTGVLGQGSGLGLGGFFTGGTTGPSSFATRQYGAGLVSAGGVANAHGLVSTAGGPSAGTTTTNFAGAGVLALGAGTNNHGVVGISSNAGTNAWGVVGWGSDNASSGNGVYGVATGNGTGVRGDAAGTGVGVRGQGAAAPASTLSTTGAGVVGLGRALGGTGVVGEGGGSGYAGGNFKGAASGGAGVIGTGGGSGQSGGVFTGASLGASNGVEGYGTGAGNGGYFEGSASGTAVYGKGVSTSARGGYFEGFTGDVYGSSSGLGLEVKSGIHASGIRAQAYTGTFPYNSRAFAIEAYGGPLRVSGGLNLPINYHNQQGHTLAHSNLIKAWGVIRTGAAGPVPIPTWDGYYTGADKPAGYVQAEQYVLGGFAIASLYIYPGYVEIYLNTSHLGPAVATTITSMGSHNPTTGADIPGHRYVYGYSFTPINNESSKLTITAQYLDGVASTVVNDFHTVQHKFSFMTLGSYGDFGP